MSENGQYSTDMEDDEADGDGEDDKDEEHNEQQRQHGQGDNIPVRVSQRTNISPTNDRGLPILRKVVTNK